MDIRTAKNEDQSSTIAEAKRSERYAIGLVAGSIIVSCVWFGMPENIKAKMLPFGAVATATVGGVLKLGLVKIKGGRLRVGDLDEAIKNYALLPAGETEMLSALKPVIEGNLTLAQLPEVQSLIETKVIQKTEEQKIAFEEKIKAAEMKSVVFPKDEDMNTKKTESDRFRGIKPEEVI